MIEKLWDGWLGDFAKVFLLPIAMLVYNRSCKVSDERRAEKNEQFDALREVGAKAETAKMSDSQAALLVMTAANEKCQTRKDALAEENTTLATANVVLKYDAAHLKEQQNQLRDRTESLTAQLAEQVIKTMALQSSALIDILPVIVWTALQDGKLDYYNKRWYDYTGLTEEQTFGWLWDKVIHPDDLQPTLDAWRASLATGEDYRILYRYKRMSDGAWRWYQGRASAIRENGVIVKWIGCSMDVHELHQSQAQPVIKELIVPKRVLLADDEPDTLTITQWQLKAGGYEIVTACDGRDAFDKYVLAKNNGRAFDVLILDYQMPAMSGEEVARAVRKSDYVTPIIVFTAVPQALTPGIRDELILSDILPKPIDNEAMLRAVRKAIAT